MDYRYENIEGIEGAAEFGPLRVEPHQGAARLRVPKRRAEADPAIASLLIEHERARQEIERLREELRRLREERGGGPAKGARRHGVFDVHQEQERQVWSQGGLERRIPRARLPRSASAWGSYPDLEP